MLLYAIRAKVQKYPMTHRIKQCLNWGERGHEMRLLNIMGYHALISRTKQGCDPRHHFSPELSDRRYQSYSVDL